MTPDPLLSAWLQPILGLVEITLILTAVYLTIAQFTRTRASSYIERFNSSEVLDNRVAVDRWLQHHATSTARLEALARDPKLTAQLRQFTNLFQELGAAYQFRVAHRRTVRVLFDALVVMYWEQLRFWIYEYRARSDPTLYARFEYLYHQVKPHLEKSASRAEYVVAYGSLMDPVSAAAAAGRKVTADELVPVILLGFRHAWSIGEHVRLGSSGEVSTAAFLDLTRDPSARLRAVMFRVSPKELRRLIRREKNYAPEDVSADVRLSGGHALPSHTTAWCFLGREQFRVDASRAKVVILQDYLDRVVSAASSIDEKLADDIWDTADQSGFTHIAGSYRFVDPEQASLV